MRLKNNLYNFQIPKSLIATRPVSPRDAAKLFIYNTSTGKITFDSFKNLANYLQPKSVLVTNDTKVLPVRLHGTKDTGGKVELFLCVNETAPKGMIRALTNRYLEIGRVVHVSTHNFKVIRKEHDSYILKPSFKLSTLNRVLNKLGNTPIPPYLKHTTMSENKLRKEYQSILAKKPASVAAPTALLHFTPRLFQSLKEKRVQQISISLHVGRGTFAPLTQDALDKKRLHLEPYKIPPKSARVIAKARQQKRPVVAVGTTVTRALESAFGKKGSLSGETDLFITPGYSFGTVDALITNFHLPNSSLMYLVQAFLQHKYSKKSIKELYDIAIKNKFRFYSFGDGMLIL